MNVVPSVFPKEWQFGEASQCKRVRCGHASLREDYLNQVQRDFLSLGWINLSTPSGLVRGQEP